MPDVADEELSEHIKSRREVERILSAFSATVVVLRAAVLLGSGSTSFEIIRQVSERMPVHTIPTWMDSLVQPIALVDALEALVSALEYTGHSRHLDVSGPDRLRYGALLDAYTSYAGLERPQVVVTLLPTALVGTLVGSLTDVPRPTVEALVESLRHDMVAADDDFREMLLPRDTVWSGWTKRSAARSLRPRRGPRTQTRWDRCRRTRPGPAAATTGPQWPRWSTRSRMSCRTLEPTG